MSAFNPIASMQRLEAAGFKRAQAEALADELRDAMSSLVTDEQLTRALDAQTGTLALRTDGVESKLTLRMDSLEERLSLRMDSLEERFSLRMSALEGNFTQRMEALGNELTLRICGILGGLMTLGFAVVGLAITLS